MCPVLMENGHTTVCSSLHVNEMLALLAHLKSSDSVVTLLTSQLCLTATNTLQPLCFTAAGIR